MQSTKGAKSVVALGSNDRA